MALKFAQTDAGNISIDFLMGLLVFVLAFAYIMTAIPGIFVPYQSASIDLGSVVYRASSILVEDPGWYKDTVNNVSFSNWEQGDNQYYVTRVGLAIDKRSPNVLSMDKIRAMQDLPYSTARNLMGLNNTVMYNFSLTLFEVGSDAPPLLNFSSMDNPDIVESIGRIVHIREGQGLLINDASLYAGLTPTQNYTVINHNPGLSGNVSIRVQGLNSIPMDSQNNITVSFYFDNASNPGDWWHFNQSADYSDHEYYIYKNGIYVVDIENADYDFADVVDIVIDTNKIRDDYPYFDTKYLSTVRVNTASLSSCFPKRCLSYDLSDQLYKYYDTEGIMTFRVWQT